MHAHKVFPKTLTVKTIQWQLLDQKYNTLIVIKKCLKMYFSCSFFILNFFILCLSLLLSLSQDLQRCDTIILTSMNTDYDTLVMSLSMAATTQALHKLKQLSTDT